MSTPDEAAAPGSLAAAVAEVQARWVEAADGPRRYTFLMRRIVSRLERKLVPFYVYNDISALLKATVDYHTEAICSNKYDRPPGRGYRPALWHRQGLIRDIPTYDVPGVSGHRSVLIDALTIAAESLRLDPRNLGPQVDRAHATLVYARLGECDGEIWAYEAEQLARDLAFADAMTIETSGVLPTPLIEKDQP